MDWQFMATFAVNINVKQKSCPVDLGNDIKKNNNKVTARYD